MIPYGRQDVTQADIEAVVEVLRSDFLTQGPAVPASRMQSRPAVTARHAVAVNSATSALHIACLALGLGKGDLLWTVPNTFVASANCARYCGADVDFVDIDSVTWNLSVPALTEKLGRAKRAGRCRQGSGTGALRGPANRAGSDLGTGTAIWFQGPGGCVSRRSARHEMASQSEVAAGRDITVFSFHPVKIITSGEGGMALTNDEPLLNAWPCCAVTGSRATRPQSKRAARGVRTGSDSGLVLRAADARFQLPHDRHPGRAGREPAGAAGRLSSSAATRWLARYDRALGGLPLQLPACSLGTSPRFISTWSG